MYVIYAYVSDGYIISYSSANHGDSLSVGTANISVESIAYQFTNIADAVTTLSFDFNGENSVEGAKGSKLFSGSMDISFEAGL